MRQFVVNDLGVISHFEADNLMRVMQAKRIEGQIIDTMLICEHQEIVTVGPRAKNDGIMPPPGYETSAVDRGGGLTWHGPGQLVIYPIFKWDLSGESNVKAIISLLEQWVIKSLGDLDVEAKRDNRMQGVWVGDNKICSIGLSFLRWTSRHGLTINYDTPKGRVEMISGCGLGQETTTSLAAIGINLSRDKILESLINNSYMLGRNLFEE